MLVQHALVENMLCNGAFHPLGQRPVNFWARYQSQLKGQSYSAHASNRHFWQMTQDVLTKVVI